MQTSPLPPEDYTALKKLLALKRYELPPPGYFQDVADRVLARIGAEQLRPRRVWWERWLEHLVARPALAGALGLFAGATLMFGVSAAQAVRTEPARDSMWLGSAPAAVQALLVDVPGAPVESASRTGMAIAPAISSIAPVLDHPSPFARISLNGAQVQPANFYPVR